MPETNLRDSLQRHLRQRLASFRQGFRQNLALIGPEGSGKTFQVQDLLTQARDLTVVSCPLYRESHNSFLRRWLGAILQPMLPAALRVDAATPVATLALYADTHYPAAAPILTAIDGLLARRQYGEAFTRILDLIPGLTQATGRPTVLVLDEFLHLEELGFSHAFHELGKRVMTWPQTLFMLTSSSPHRARLILRERLHLLFGQFETLDLDALDPTRAVPWIHAMLRGLRGGARVAPFLLSWMGGSPWYLTVFLRRLRELAMLRRTTVLTEALFVEAAWDVVGSAHGTLHQACAARIQQTAHGREGRRAVEALLQLAQGARTSTDLGQRIGRAGVSHALQLLLEQDLVERKGACWLVRDAVLRCWLTGILAPQHRGLSGDESILREPFQEELLRTWQRWIQTTQLSFPDQMIRLLETFQDDTVVLDEKTGRLPRFTQVARHEAGAYLVADGPGRRWCCAVEGGSVTEEAVTTFETFCRGQWPRPSRKVLITGTGLDEHARLVAKAHNMWVWGPHDVELLRALYPPSLRAAAPAASRRNRHG